MFKAVKSEQPTTTYCDGQHHILVTVPANQYAHETYGIDLQACDCPAPVEAPTPDAEPPATHEEFEKL